MCSWSGRCRERVSEGSQGEQSTQASRASSHPQLHPRKSTDYGREHDLIHQPVTHCDHAHVNMHCQQTNCWGLCHVLGRLRVCTLCSTRKPPKGCIQVAIIPARYESSRFPGKPLVEIAGKLMIQRTWEQACAATCVTEVYVATDDDRIKDACDKFGAKVIMTSKDCPNGTARCAEAARKLPAKYDLVLNVQGDEPLLEPAVMNAVVQTLQDAPDEVRLFVRLGCACGAAPSMCWNLVRMQHARYFSPS